MGVVGKELIVPTTILFLVKKSNIIITSTVAKIALFYFAVSRLDWHCIIMVCQWSKLPHKLFYYNARPAHECTHLF